MWQIWEFAFKIASIWWENCENLLSEVGGIMLMENLSICVFQSFQRWVKMVLMENVTKCEYLCLKMNILLVKSEYLLFEMGGNGINEESENLSWKVSIFNGKSWAFVLHLVFEMAVPLPAQFPLLVVFCGIKWKMNPKLFEFSDIWVEFSGI